jgi:hypothetical protein
MLPKDVVDAIEDYEPLPPSTYDDRGFFAAARRVWGVDYGPKLIELGRQVEKAFGKELIFYLQETLPCRHRS